MSSRKIPRIIYNDDSCTLRTAPPPHTPETLSIALDYLKGTQVDCLCWCVATQIAYSWPSKVMENIFELRDRGVRNAATWETGRDVMDSLYRQGIDYLPLLIRLAHEQGLMFVAGFRMNDTHHKSDPESVLTPDFWKQNQHYRLWEVTDGKSYYNANFDYSHAEVRNRFREAVLEVARWYDVDGIELDFTRSPYFFQPSEAWRKRAILTDFVREISEQLEQIGTQRKRPLTLILRIPCLPRALKTAGIDAEEWIRQRLAPIMVISELVNNYNQDISSWREQCRAAGVLLYPAVESGLAFNIADFYTTQVRNPLGPRHDGSGGVRFPLEEDLAMQRAAAQNLLAQEPDGLYMFNFPCRLAEGDNIMHTDPERFAEATSLLREMGSLTTLAKTRKHYTFYKDLPIYVEANRPRRFHQTIPFAVRGSDLAGAKATLRWRQVAERNPHAPGVYRQNPLVKPGILKCFLNDREIAAEELHHTRAAAGRILSGFKLRTHEIVELTVPGSELRNGENTLAFEMPHFPRPRDPYVYMYDFTVDLEFDEK